MKDLTLNIYNDKGEVVKTSKAQIVDIKFGTIRSLMKLFNIEDINDTGTLLKTVYSAWDKLIKILDKSFPDVTEEEWDYVKVNELLSILFDIFKYTFAQMMSIPKDDSKNLIAE